MQIGLEELIQVQGIGPKTLDQIREHFQMRLPAVNHNLPNKKYQVIYADPPWRYRDEARSGKRGAEFKYPVMSIEEITNLPVYAIAKEDCALFLWVTCPQLPVGLRVLCAWGFEYRTIAFTWLKPGIGMGSWTRAQTELCLLGVRGSPQRIDASVRQGLVEAPTEHSKKPHEIRKRIEKLFGEVDRIELFAREQRSGWDCWGNEVKRRCDR